MVADIFQERVVYNKEIQTAVIEEESGPTIEELRQQLRQEYERAQQLQKDKELEEEAARLDKEIEEEIRGRSIVLSHRNHSLICSQKYRRRNGPAFSSLQSS